MNDPSAVIITPVDGLRQPVSVEGVLIGLLTYSLLIVTLFALTKFLPGKKVVGDPPGDGTQPLTHKINGMSLFVAAHMVVFICTWMLGWSLTPLLEHFWSLLVAANIITLVWLVLMNRRSRARLAKVGDDSGADDDRSTKRSVLAQLWRGLELNPRFLGVDLELFSHQPSLISLGLLNLAFAWTQYEQLGELTPQMLVYQVLCWGYLFSHYWFEDALLSRRSVSSERFGVPIVWRALVVVPFFYSLGGWWILRDPEPMPIWQLVAIVALYALGLWILREANAQKSRFEQDPGVEIWGKPARALDGGLLISGWWGIGRNLNYTGEIMVYASFALCTGFSSPLPYLLPLFMCVMLSHRAWRDQQHCEAKYGLLWDEYKKIAKFRMIPWLY